uniref:Cytochrome P450 6a9 n=1 Tax=Cacopsylla melanoneura TaxID=428564 RepID=A0A8D8TAI8_9HEMI
MFYFFSSVFNCLSLIFIVLLLLLIRVYFWTVDSYKFFKNLGLPYEEPKFLIGNLRNYPLISKNKHQFYFVEEIYKKHADKTYVGFFKFRKPMLMIRDPIICQQVFTTYFEHFCNRPGPPVDPKKDPLSNHLINMQVADIHRTELSFDTNDPTSEANKDYITESIIMSNTFLFLTTGYESTATTTASVLYELALNEDVQEKVRQEVRDHIGQWSYSSIASLKYLDQVICESQRLHPVNTSLSRQCTSDQFKLPGTDVYIPRGTHVCIPTFAMYKDPKFFSNPDRFNPENFSKENTKQLKILCPFGEGPRQCIAKSYSLIEVKLAIAHLILKFKFKRCSKTDVPLQYIPEKLFITPANGIWIGFEKILS